MKSQGNLQLVSSQGQRNKMCPRRRTRGGTPVATKFISWVFITWLFLVFGTTTSVVWAQIKPQFITEFRLDRETITLPFEYRQNQIMVRGQADDKKDLTFIFDTGA